MPYPNEHSARLQDPGKFDPDTFRRKRGGALYGTIKVPVTIAIIWGKLKGKAGPDDPAVPQALRFPVKNWTASEAKSWLRKNKVKYSRFEPATTTKKEGAQKMSAKIERRFVGAEMASVALEERDEGESHIVGTGAVVYDGTNGTEYELWPGGPVERIMPGAFDRALGEGDDVRGLFNHNPDHLLGRTMAGTMKLYADGKGLHYDIQPPATPIAAQVRESIRRGDLSGSSFSFSTLDEEWKKVDGKRVREIRSVRLFDLGPVTFPAYKGTTAGIRSEDMAEVRAIVDNLEAEEQATEAAKMKIQQDQCKARDRLVKIGSIAQTT